MKALFLSALIGLTLVASGCGTTSAYPDEFWALGSWHFAKEAKLSFGASGEAAIMLHFIRRYGDQYEIEGGTDYVDDRFFCSFDVPSGGRICPVPTCLVESWHDGTFTGVASIENGILTAKPVWRAKDYPIERVAAFCDTDDLLVESDGALLMQSLQGEGGLINSAWTIDLNDAVFIDDVPTDTMTDAKIASISFDVLVPSMVQATALFGLYRQKPE